MKINKKLLQPIEPKFKGARSELLKKTQNKTKSQEKERSDISKGRKPPGHFQMI